MGAMLIGMITGGIAWMMFIISSIINAVIMFFLARYLKMNSVKWAVSGLILNFYCEVFFVIALIAMNTRKCKSCSARVENIDGCCVNCGEKITKLDDGRFALRYPFFIWIFIFGICAIVMVICSVLSELGVVIEI
ncbi:MAG: hypothetical protein IKK63_07315 [Clostridia bacterium]|nr:hypothetical protein [Clostridia bacterium]